MTKANVNIVMAYTVRTPEAKSEKSLDRTTFTFLIRFSDEAPLALSVFEDGGRVNLNEKQSVTDFSFF